MCVERCLCVAQVWFRDLPANLLDSVSEQAMVQVLDGGVRTGGVLGVRVAVCLCSWAHVPV